MARKHFIVSPENPSGTLVDFTAEEETAADAMEAQAENDKAAWAAKAYSRNRHAAYKDIKEQLDQLYHDMAADKGDKTGTWFAAVKAVKDANPKP